MPIYVYETIPQKTGERPKQFELQQSMKDAPLTQHPENGALIRRVISGGYGFSGSTKQSTGNSSCCGGSGCGCH